MQSSQSCCVRLSRVRKRQTPMCDAMNTMVCAPVVGSIWTLTWLFKISNCTFVRSSVQLRAHLSSTCAVCNDSKMQFDSVLFKHDYTEHKRFVSCVCAFFSRVRKRQTPTRGVTRCRLPNSMHV